MQRGARCSACRRILSQHVPCNETIQSMPEVSATGYVPSQSGKPHAPGGRCFTPATPDSGTAGPHMCCWADPPQISDTASHTDVVSEPPQPSFAPGLVRGPCLRPASPVVTTVVQNQVRENLPPLLSAQIPHPPPLLFDQSGLSSARILSLLL